MSKVFIVTLESDNQEIGVDELYLALSGTWRGVSVQVEAAEQPLAPDVAETCDCGEPFPESGYCNFCGARQRLAPVTQDRWAASPSIEVI